VTGGFLLKAALLAFHWLHGTRDGKSMAETVIRLLDCANITTNVYFFNLFLITYHFDLQMITSMVGHWTFNNAANNGTFMEELVKILLVQEIPRPFDAQDNHIMCFPHVINICCKYVIHEFTNVELTNGPETAPTPLPSHNNQSYNDLV
jgi:hypothetical protein